MFKRFLLAFVGWLRRFPAIRQAVNCIDGVINKAEDGHARSSVMKALDGCSLTRLQVVWKINFNEPNHKLSSVRIQKAIKALKASGDIRARGPMLYLSGCYKSMAA